MIVRDLLIKLGFSADTSGIDKVESKIGGLKSGANALSIAAGNVLANLAQQGLSKAVGVIQDGVDQSVQFGRELANVSSLIGGDQLRTRELAADVQRMALEFGKGTSEINKGLYDLIGTLGDSKDVTQQLSLAMKLGAAGAGTTADGLAVLTAVTKAYGDTSIGAMQTVADLASQTVNLGKITLPELAASIGQVTPLSSQLGISMQEVAAQVATLTGVTGSGAEVMTQISSAMRSVIDRSKPMQAAFNRAFKAEGIKTAKDAIGKYGFVGTLDKLIKTTDGSQEQVQALFGRIEGLKLALSLTGNQSSDFREKLAAMGNVAGTVEEQYKAQITGLGEMGHEMDLAKAANDKLARSIGEKSAPAMVLLEKASLQVKDVFANSFLPMIMGSNGAMEDSVAKTNDFAAALSALQAVGFVVAETLDVIVTTVRELWHSLVGVGSVLYNLSTGNISGIGKDLGTQGQAMFDIGRGLSERTSARLKVPDVASIQAMQQTAGAPGVAGKATVNMPVGGINITVNAAPGTEASAVARASDTAARNLIDQLMQNAASSTGPGY